MNEEVDVSDIIGKFSNMVDTYKSRGLSGMSPNRYLIRKLERVEENHFETIMQVQIRN